MQCSWFRKWLILDPPHGNKNVNENEYTPYRKLNSLSEASDDL